jgi:3-hydroxyisobutyrate dehydrogenase
MKVAILGAGRMGSAMALRLIDSGQQVTVWNRERARLAPLADAGASVADDVTAAVAGASVVITMVTDGAAVRSFATQMLPAMAPDAVWVQASTVGAEWPTACAHSPTSTAARCWMPRCPAARDRPATGR